MSNPIPGTVDRIYLDANNAWLMRCVIVDTDATHMAICVPLETEHSPWAVGDAVLLDATTLDGRWSIIVCDYLDAQKQAHVMCACGHYVTGPALGTNIALCPNCHFRARFGESIPLVHANRMPT